jgi:hypothetical protein
VLEEKLTIIPLPEMQCFQLDFRGRSLDKWNQAPVIASPPTSEEFATVTQRISCPGNVVQTGRELRFVWQAQVEYRVEALALKGLFKFTEPLLY